MADMLTVDETWNRLEQGIETVMSQFESGLSYEDYMQLYTLVYNYCTRSAKTTPHGMREPMHQGRQGANLLGGELYEKLKRYFDNYLNSKLQETKDLTSEQTLVYYSNLWKKYTVGVTLIHHIFRYLNRHWIKREVDEGRKGIYEVYTLALVTWKECFFMSVEKTTVSAALKMIENQRHGLAVDSALLKSLSDSFVDIGLDESDSNKSTLDVYKKHFEEPFIKETQLFYAFESKKFINEHAITEYMKKVESRLLEEETRVQLYLHQSTGSLLLKCCETELIQTHLKQIQNEFQLLLDQQKQDDLQRMYMLLNRIPGGLDELRRTFETHVKKQGLVAMDALHETINKSDDRMDQESKKPVTDKTLLVDPESYVTAILAVYKKFMDLACYSFKQESGFIASLDRACREFINQNSACKSGSKSSPELLARYCDSLLKKGSKVVEEGEIEEILSKIMIVFKYLDDKDVFQKFYAKMLAKRLVNTTSSSDDAEALMISKLKESSGFEYTNKLQRMFTDVGVSRELNSKFKETMERTHSKDELLDFSILVGNTASWPLTAPSTTFTIPQDLVKTFERFTLFYQNQYSGRTLNWLFNISKADLKTNYLTSSKAGYTFQVSTYQLGILLLYNTCTCYKFSELLSCTGLNEETLNNCLNILVRAKVLLVEPAGTSENNKESLQTSKYTLNMDFKSKKIRVNLNLPMKSEQKAENEQTQRTIDEDRGLLLQAAIVRIMKTRKRLKHNLLITEVINQVQNRFKPQISDIKKSIDKLLEKEYIERVDGEKDTYDYLA